MGRRAFHLGDRNAHIVRSGSHSSRRLQFERMEDRRLLTTFTVTNLSDAAVTGPNTAPGTLRQAIYDANVSQGADLIQFADSLAGEIKLSIADDSTVGPSSFLITSDITIDGSSHRITIERDAAAAKMRVFYVTAAGNLNLQSLTISGGVAQGANGATGQSGSAGLGGAIYNQGHVSLFASTLFGNSAIGGSATGGAAGRGLGGAVYNDGGNLSIQNSTLSGNSVSSGTGSTVASFGGAVYSKNGTLNVSNSTITSNAASSGRDFYIVALGGGQTAVAQIYSSIIARGDLPTLGFDFLVTSDQGGTVSVTGANNLIRSQNDFQSINMSSGDPGDPMLSPLANNGGPTNTHALSVNSPAIDHGSNPLALAKDQRGGPFIRVQGNASDIGAFELQPVSQPPLPGDYNNSQVVDAADFVLWRKTQGGQVPQFSGADGSGNGQIDDADYGVWRGQFGATLSPPSTGSLALESTANIQIAAPPQKKNSDVEAEIRIAPPIDLASLNWYAAHSDRTTIYPRLSRENPIRIQKSMPRVADQVQEEALLAVVEEHFAGGEIFSAPASREEEIDFGPSQFKSTELTSLLNGILNPVLPQKPGYAAASTYTA